MHGEPLAATVISVGLTENTVAPPPEKHHTVITVEAGQQKMEGVLNPSI
jgi:hypothetical protein